MITQNVFHKSETEGMSSLVTCTADTRNVVTSLFYCSLQCVCQIEIVGCIALYMSVAKWWTSLSQFVQPVTRECLNPNHEV